MPALQPGTVWDVTDESRTVIRSGRYIPKPRILVAHSYGALVAIAYAVRHPSEIAGMVLVGPVATRERGEPSESHLKTYTKRRWLRILASAEWCVCKRLSNHGVR
jgi:pimeloyl-ACP methyl ester carboxylesterase